MASLRVLGRLIENAWVGPPATSRSAPSAASAVAALTSTAATSTVSAGPAAIASAICLVLPNIDSYTTSASMIIHPLRVSGVAGRVGLRDGGV